MLSRVWHLANCFFWHELKTRLDLLKPNVGRRVISQQWLQKSHHDRCSHDRAFSVGQAVFVRDYRVNFPKWSAGHILKLLGPLSYLISLNDGVVVHRHADQIQVHFNVATDSNQIQSPPSQDWIDRASDSSGDDNDTMEESSESQEVSNVAGVAGPLEHPPVERRYPARDRHLPERPGFVSY